MASAFGVCVHSTALGATAASRLPEDTHCMYPSKVCTNPRAMKQDKTLHRFCELHRRRANLNQQRMQQRRRAMQRQDEDGNNSAVTSERLLEMDDSLNAATDFQAREFSPEELHILERMLFESGEYLYDDDFELLDANLQPSDHARSC